MEDYIYCLIFKSYEFLYITQIIWYNWSDGDQTDSFMILFGVVDNTED